MSEHLLPCGEQFVGAVTGEELTPVVGGMECLVAAVMICGLFGGASRLRVG
jgi:hypothetical protein